MNYCFRNKTLIFFIMVCCFCLLSSPVAMAGYAVGFASDKIQITNPPRNGTEVNGILPISGTAKVDEVWFCVRGPQNEVEAQSASVSAGSICTDFSMCFGPV